MRLNNREFIVWKERGSWGRERGGRQGASRQAYLR